MMDMKKRRQYRELPDVELTPENEEMIRVMIVVADEDIARRRSRGGERSVDEERSRRR